MQTCGEAAGRRKHPCDGEPRLDNLTSVWSALSTGRRILVVVATVAVFAAVLLLARTAGSKDMSLLFGGLDAAAAGDVITALDQRGVTYDVRGNAIYVPTAQRDVLRMGLAGEGLPANSSSGYELLDSLSGFSTTSQMFDAAYWRAKEGELARTILASPHVRAARVHISTPTNQLFQRDQAPTAAVTVTTAGGALATNHVKALQYLVGAAVQGLDPVDVAVIDDSGALLSDGDAETGLRSGDERAVALRQRAERLLSARVGPGNAVVEVSLDTVTETETILERRVDPDSRIAISTDVTESAGTSTDRRAGDVTVASNLPDGDADAGNGSSSNENSESRTLTNYEVSETERQLLREPGAVKRLTVAVLVNEITQTAADGTVTSAPRDEEELAALRELVASAVGLDTARGDVLTLRSMPFEPVAAEGTTAGVPTAPAALDLMQLIQVAVLAAVALILGLFVVRPIFASAGAAGTAPLAIAAGQDDDLGDPPITMAINNDSMGDFIGGDFGDGDGLTSGEDPVGRMRRMIAEREPETLQILQDWIENPQPKVGT